ncbi:MAG: rhomboid family intramembrane serine protease [Syntrophales bacterium]
MGEKKSMLCPNCRRLISNDEPACPYCGYANPGARWKKAFAGRTLLGNIDPVMAVVIVNSFFYLLSLLIDLGALGMAVNPMTFLSPSEKSVFLLGATGTFPIGYGRWWTLLSASYLHGGLLHILFNMMALKQLAPFVIDAFGLNRFAVLYVWTGVAGFFLSWLAGVPFTLGASAAICGLIGAIVYYGKSRGGVYGEAIYRQAMGWIVGLVLFGLFLPGINNWAHGGGIVSGIAIAFLVGYDERRRETAFIRMLGTASIILTAGTLLWAVFQAFYYSA